MIKDIPQSLIDAVKKVLYESIEHPMIEVDGVMRHRNNSLGQPIHHTDEGIRNFHRWFGDSQVVDEHGRPQVVYHATKHKFDSFDYEKIGNGYNRFGPAFYFTNDPKTLDIYKGEGGNLIPAYIRASKIQKTDAMSKEDINNFFDSLQVKRFNNGYDATNDHENIRNSALEEPDRAFSRIISNTNIYIDKNDFLNGLHKIGVHATIRNVFGHPEYAVYDNTNIKATNNSGAFAHPTKITESIEHPMIEVDGVMKHRHNSLGQPIHHTDEGIRNFHRWFGDSKVVDEYGRPKVVYHGTTKDFDNFDPNLANSEGGAFYFSHSSQFKNPATNANTYANTNRGSEDGSVMPVYIKMSNPYITGFNKPIPKENDSLMTSWFNEMEKFNRKLVKNKNSYYRQEIRTARRNGHDGVIINNVEDDRQEGLRWTDPTDVHAAFNPSQIKSAIGNNGNFSHPTKITESEEDYRGSHTAPSAEFGAPAHDLTRVYPQDFYSSRGSQYYGDGRPEDKRIHTLLASFKNKPDADVMIYRAVPNESSIKEINPGDWVTPNLHYAVEHGNRFDSSKILSKMVKASEIYTDGNSFHEFGYHPNK